MQVFNILDFGAKGDGQSNDAKAIQAAIDACTKAGGGRVILPAGKTYYSGGIQMKSNIEFYIQQGATLKASANADDYLVLGDDDHMTAEYGRPEGVKPMAFIHGLGAEHLTITGGGTIDGNARSFIAEDTPFIYKMKDRRARLILLEKCHHLRVNNITIRDGAFWTLHPAGCEDVVIDGVTILNDLKVPNCDGIDPDHCRNVRISNCHIEAGDDCIVIKNHGEFVDYGPTENITITNCTLVSTSCAIKLGTESQGDFRNITVSNCIIDRSNRGIGIQIRDWGKVENVLYQNIVINTRHFDGMWWGKAEPIHISLAPRREGDKTAHFKGIHFQNIRCQSESGVVLYAHEGCEISDVVFDGLDIELYDESRHEKGWLDVRPLGGEEHGGLEQAEQVAFRAFNIKGLQLLRHQFTFKEGPNKLDMPFYDIKNCEDSNIVQQA